MADLVTSLWILIFPIGFILFCLAGSLIGRFLRWRLGGPWNRS